MSQPTETKRQLRHKHRKVYADADIDEDDIEGKRTYDLNEKLQSNRYNADFVSEMKGDDVTLKYFQESGFSMPFLVKEKTGLGIRIPSQNFHVSDVKRCVGSRRILDVMDVNTQKAMNMNMKDWVTYYEDKSDRERLLNVISLEFSHTKLETYVQQPAVVRQVDWVENSWPQFLKDLQRETTNLIDRMMYPKVQKYTLMSVAGCYTDFHIDMGGTSVWYHILHGKKIFWLIPPTDENLAAYESWIMSANQGEVFLADTVTGCERVELEEGYTFFIPSGWIHAVYTPVDSLVFGGNFLHSYGITMQLKVWQVESKTHVAGKFRYPFFVDIHWYVLQRYVSLLTGKEHRVKSDEELSQEITRKPRKKLSVDSLDLHDDRSNDSMASDPSFTSETDDFKSPKSRMSPFTSNKQNIEADQLSRSVLNDNDSLKAPMCVESSGDLVKRIVTSKEWTHLTCYERQGLKAILELFDHLPRSKWSVPVDIPNPLELLDDTRSLLSEHAGDEQDQAASGTLLLKWPERKKPKAAPRQHSGTPRGHGVPKPDWKNKTKGKERSGNRHRRVRCKLCEPCTRTECRECKFCRDMKKFGGSGTMKQCCISKQCLAPVLANKAHCSICGHQEIANASLSDWTIIHVDVDVSGGALYECSGCWEIVHPYCVLQRDIKLKKEDLLKEEALVKDEVKSEADATADGATGLPEGGAIPTEIKLEVVVSAEEVQEVVSALKYREALVNEDLPSSWECPRCCDQDKVQQLKDSIKEMNKSQEGSGKQDNNATSAVETTSMNPQVPVEGTSDTTPTKHNTIDSSFLSPPTMTPHKNSPEPRSILSNLSPPDISPVPTAISRPNVANDSRQSIFDVLNSQSLSPTSENRAPTMTENMNLQLAEGPPSITPDATSNIHTEKIVSPMMEAPGLQNCDVLMATEEATAARVASPNTTPTSSKITTAYSDTSANEQSPSPPPPPAEDLAATLRAAKQQKATALYDFDSSSPRSLTSDHGDATPEKSHRRPIENGGKSAGNGQKRKNGNTAANTSNGSQEKKAKTEDTPKGGTSNNDSTTPPSGQPLKIKEEPLDPPASRTIPQHMKTCSLMVHKYVVRPAPTHNLPRRHQMDHADGPDSTLLSIREWMTIFSYLFPHELCTVMCVCKAWCQWAMQPSLWQNINLVRKTIKKACLIGIIRRQPRTLDLSWTNINSVRFTWLIMRLPQLRGLCFRGNHWTAASAMCSASCPLLYDLDLSWVQGVKDDCMRDLLPPPVNHRPGVDCSLSRMRRLTTLSISGTDIGDGTLLLVSQHLVSLMTLDVSFCIKVTNKGLTHLADKKSVVKTTILNLDLSACKQLTDDCLKSLHLLTSLITFCLADSPNIPPEGAEQFRNNFNKNRRKMSHNAGVAYKPLVLHLNDTLQVCQS